MNILQNQPLFELSIKSFGVSYGALVNGIYVQIQFDPESKEDMTLPINHYFTSGENEIGLKVMPEESGGKFNPASYVELNLTVRNFGTDVAHPLLALTFNGSELPEMQESLETTYLNTEVPFDASDEGEIKIGSIQVSPMEDFLGGLKITQLTSIPSNLPRWKFLDSEDIPLPTDLNDNDYDQSLEDLFTEYKKIQDALSSKNINEILSLFEERSREMDLAFYEPLGSTQAQLKETLQETLSDKDMQLADIKAAMMGFGYTESTKLRALVRADQGAAIGYDYKDGGSRGFPIIFRRENDQWIITR